MSICLPHARGGERCYITGKRCRTEKAAAEWLRGYKRETAASRAKGKFIYKLYAYHCTCGHWHITKQKPR